MSEAKRKCVDLNENAANKPSPSAVKATMHEFCPSCACAHPTGQCGRTDLTHWLREIAGPKALSDLGLPPDTLDDTAVLTMYKNPNCKPLCNHEAGTSLLIAQSTQKFVGNNLRSTIPIGFHFHTAPLENEGLVLTRCEAQAFNDIVASVTCKPVNKHQLEHKDFILSAFRDDINYLCYALIQHELIANQFKLYLNMPWDVDDKDAERWDNVKISYPFSQVMLKLRNDYKQGNAIVVQSRSAYHWRDAGDDMENFRLSVIALIKMIWIAVHSNC